MIDICGGSRSKGSGTPFRAFILYIFSDLLFLFVYLSVSPFVICYGLFQAPVNWGWAQKEASERKEAELYIF